MDIAKKGRIKPKVNPITAKRVKKKFGYGSGPKIAQLPSHVVVAQICCKIDSTVRYRKKMPTTLNITPYL